MHLTAAVDTLALLQHDENTPKDCSEVTHRGMLDHIGGEHGLCPSGHSVDSYDSAVFDLFGETPVVLGVYFP